MTVEATYWCSNCRKRFKASFPGDDAPEHTTCLYCQLLAATRCSHPKRIKKEKNDAA